VATLGWAPGVVSIKPSAENFVVTKLVEQILVDGFVTNGEPLLVSQPEVLQGEGSKVGKITCFSLGYVKGQARAVALLLVLSVISDGKGVQLAEVGR
jgi:hypothetical protein